jgi:hypothetical protein
MPCRCPKSRKTDFATEPGQGSNIGHGSMLHGNERLDLGKPGFKVLFAGQFETDDKGEVQSWDNMSGHFLPTSASAQAAPFPIDKYQSYHVEAFKAAQTSLNCEILRLLTENVLPKKCFKISDVAHLVGGSSQILNYGALDGALLADSAENRGVANVLKEIKDLKQRCLEKVKEEALEIFRSFTASNLPEDDLPSAFVNSLESYCTSLLDGIIECVEQHQRVGLQNEPQEGKSYSGCKHFNPPKGGPLGTCAVVSGEIQTSYWCGRFEQR